jgi:cyclohexadienyl dehydratase
MFRFIYCLLFVISCTSNPLDPTTSNKVFERNTLVVGTTGDYAPFSFYQDNQLVGIDIDLARMIAKKMGVKIKLVKTSWPTLLQDLYAEKFDVAISGITINEERQQVADFSVPYHSYGKLPIVRCQDRDKYNSLAKIDVPQTRMVVNPGGTNFKFAKENIKKAQVRLVNDNTKIFGEIKAERADVMITDSTEVFYQSKISQGKLCPTGRTLTQSQVGILTPKGQNIKIAMNHWLKEFKRNGELDKLFKKWMAR